MRCLTWQRAPDVLDLITTSKTCRDVILEVEPFWQTCDERLTWQRAPDVLDLITTSKTCRDVILEVEPFWQTCDETSMKQTEQAEHMEPVSVTISHLGRPGATHTVRCLETRLLQAAAAIEDSTDSCQGRLRRPKAALVQRRSHHVRHACPRTCPCPCSQCRRRSTQALLEKPTSS